MRLLRTGLIVIIFLVSCNDFNPTGSELQNPFSADMAKPSVSFSPTPTRVLTKATPRRFPSCNASTWMTAQLSVTPFPIADISSIQPYPSPSLRELAEARGMFVGAAVTPWLFADEFFSRMLSQQFNMIAAENAMKWEVIHPEPERYDFSQGDALVSFAQKTNMSVFAHVLVWDLQMPTWVTDADHSKNEWINILCKHIKTVVSHYRGKVYAWNVVNEAINDDGTLRNTFWMRKIGPEHIAMAFQWAREADPGVLLFYNDNGGEGINPKSQAIYTLVKNLRDGGIPIDGIGMQMHTAIYQAPSMHELQFNLQRLAELGLEIHITEMDVKLQYAEEDDDKELAAQAETYRRVIDACVEVENCKGFSTWGLIDRFSWIPGWTGNPDAPLLFDDDAKPKPAYYAVQDALKQR